MLCADIFSTLVSGASPPFPTSGADTYVQYRVREASECVLLRFSLFPPVLIPLHLFTPLYLTNSLFRFDSLNFI